MDPNLRKMARFFYALKDPLRLQILATLAQAGEMTVTQLVRTLHVSQPLISWHLGRLRGAEVVHVERDGRTARYSIVEEEIEKQFSAFHRLLAEGLTRTDE